MRVGVRVRVRVRVRVGVRVRVRVRTSSTLMLPSSCRRAAVHSSTAHLASKHGRGA